VSRTKPSKKPKRQKRARNLSDPKTLSELALRLKEGIYITTLDGEIIDANPAFLEMFGVASLNDLKGHRTSDFVRPEVRAREMALLEREGAVRDVEFQLTRRDGETRTVVDSAFLSVDPKTGEKYCYGILVDITHRKELQTQLLELSIRDPLTGCYNRRYLNTVTRQCEAQPKGEWGCIYLDIDHFKQYNDAHGHPAGDEVLKRVGTVLQEAIQDADFAARYGGEEFFVLMPELRSAGAAAMAARIRQLIAQQQFPGGPVTLSFGVAEFPVNGDSGEALIAAADVALYEAKHAGRDRAAVAHTALPAMAADRRGSG